ncbi:hypothetical protein DNTS_027410 [Danionella cerebrum]|uniref:Uncharacterized protein n=1 Tax=Danionella cerebrum TaxID=2873325 RepID=A0A553N2K9_9TELE|nr:hypothetical protein DNTS_027410 [Danionella translucida]
MSLRSPTRRKTKSLPNKCTSPFCRRNTSRLSRRRFLLKITRRKTSAKSSEKMWEKHFVTPGSA